MNKKYLTEESEEEVESTSPNNYLNNQNNELFDEESAVVHPLLSIRRVSLPKDGENWEILADNRVVLTILGIKLNKKERSFLRTPTGFKCLLAEYKAGNTTQTEIKKKLKEQLN